MKLLITLLVVSSGLVAQSPPQNVPGPAQPIVEALQAAESMFTGLDATARRLAQETQAQTAAQTDPAVGKKSRRLKNTMVIVASGAASGAAIGATVSKGNENATIVGALAGGIVGLIYDQVTQKTPKTI